MRAGAIAGYSGTDPVLTGPGLARLVARDEARYVVLGGAYASRGGDLATRAVLRACRHVPARAWHGPVPTSIYTLVLFDCAGRERQLSQARRTAPIRSAATSRLRSTADVAAHAGPTACAGGTNARQALIDVNQRPDRRVGPHLAGGGRRHLHAPEALGKPVLRAFEPV